jgi:glycosyltransferase involved in cell wall biosynthesis
MLPSSMISGGGKVILQQADELGRRGHRVTVVCPEDPPEWFSLGHARYERAAFESSSAIPEADVTVATFWTTIAPAVSTAPGSLFHLCQGIESDSAYYSGESEAIEAAYRRIPRKIVVSPHLRGFLESRGFTDVVDVGQSFEAADFRFEGRRFDRTPLRVLLSGIFEIDLKGVGEALEGLRRLRDRGSMFHLFRASPEPVSPAERKFKLIDEYHRAVSPRRIPALLAHVDVFLGPNHEVEGFGLPTLEALAAGLPAALSDTPSHRGMAGDCAVFFAPRDPEAIAFAISRLLEEPETRRRLSDEGPVRAARFRTSDVGERLERVFQSAGAV